MLDFILLLKRVTSQSGSSPLKINSYVDVDQSVYISRVILLPSNLVYPINHIIYYL